MATLDRDFEAACREALLDEMERKLVGERNNLVFQAVQRSHEVLREYGDQYDIEPVIQSLTTPTVERDARSVTARWGWEHPAAPYFAYGTSTHTIEGQPVLSFVWEDPPDWVAQEFEPEGDGYRVFLPEVEVEGIDRTAFVQAGVRWLRDHLRS